jgi:hypothetical protein
MTSNELLNLTKGLPFIDPGFEPKVLLTLVASLRAKADGHGLPVLSAYLTPRNAAALYRKTVENAPEHPRCVSLNTSLTDELHKAIARIIAKHPEWRLLFVIPIEWRQLTTGQVSSTNPLIPQHVYLGCQAFRQALQLEETIVHEMSHVWCSLLAEIIDFQTKEASHDLTLPSGTTGKSVRGVLLAALFAAAAINFYHVSGEIVTGSEARATYLRQYLERCVDVIRRCIGVSHFGREVNDRLAIFLKNRPILNREETHADNSLS